MLFELYKANAAKAPKNQQQALPLSKPGQTSPTSAETEPSKVAAIATNGAAADNHLNEAASKNLQGDEMAKSNTNGERAAVVMGSVAAAAAASQAAPPPTQAPFHPRIKFSNVSKQMTAAAATAASSSCNATAEPKTSTSIITAIPTSVLVSTTTTPPQEPIDIKPLIHPTTGLVIEPTSAAASVIQPAPSTAGVVPQAAAIAAALLRDGYHNFQQQLRAQEILKLNQVGAAAAAAAAVAATQSTTQSETQPTASVSGTHVTPTKLFENFLRQQRAEQQQQQRHHSECERNDSSTDTNDGDDEEEDSRYNGFDDIHLIEGSKTATFNSNNGGQHHNLFPSHAPQPSDYMSDESQKFMIAAQAHAFRNLEYSLSDYGGNSPGEGEPTYECRHCGKKYRWKSTLRRHENVECGGKEPMHQCPYCPYKSKQRGNLGVHVRKHHSNLPQLASKRRSKYSVKLEGSLSVGGGGGGEPGSANVSDDSSSKLMIDCSK